MPRTAPPDRPSIGAAIIAKDEERCLERCLRSLSWVDEIILIDDGSTDKTAEIAGKFDCRVIHHPMVDFADQRNLALRNSTSEWILHIDADEECSPSLATEILNRIGSDSHDGYYLLIRNRFLGRIMRGRDWSGHYGLRLGKRSVSFWERPVHEVLKIEGSTARLESPLEHHSELDYSGRILKSNRYSSAEAELLAQRGKQFHIWMLFAIPSFRALKSYTYKGGWRDGIHGLIWAGHVWWSNFAIYVKLWELKR